MTSMLTRFDYIIYVDMKKVGNQKQNGELKANLTNTPSPSLTLRGQILIYNRV